MQRRWWQHARQSMLIGLVALSFLPSMAQAVSVSFTGFFTRDDEVQLFPFTIGGPATVTLQTLGYAGGTNAAGDIIAAGGFDPIVTLFDGAGNFVGENDDRDFDQGIFDAFLLQLALAPGNYTVALTQFDNFAIDPPGSELPSLASGFERQGMESFTGAEFCANPGGRFMNLNCEQRSSAWALDIVHVDTASQVPEPGTWVLMGTGLVWLLAYGGRKR